jgi:hypothetical protein
MLQEKQKQVWQLILDARIQQKRMAPTTQHANVAPTQDGSQPE